MAMVSKFVLLTAARVRWLAARTGARVVDRRDWVDGEGRARVAWRLLWPSHAARLRALNLLADLQGKRDPRLRVMAVFVASHAPAGRLALAKFVHAVVRDGVRFTGEGSETFTDAVETLQSGVGDCDDSALAVVALLIALGFRARIRGLARKRRGKPRGNPTHACGEVDVGTARNARWRWVETTLAAKFGEHPYAAHSRLKVKGREDV